MRTESGGRETSLELAPLIHKPCPNIGCHSAGVWRLALRTRPRRRILADGVSECWSSGECGLAELHPPWRVGDAFRAPFYTHGLTIISLFHSATPAPSFSLCRVSRLTPALAGFGPKNFIITEKKDGVRKTPKKVTPIIPANTAVPSA